MIFKIIDLLKLGKTNTSQEMSSFKKMTSLIFPPLAVGTQSTAEKQKWQPKTKM